MTLKISGIILLGSLLIFVSGVLIMKIFGIISPAVSSFIISWQLLLIVVGLAGLCRRIFWAGSILIIVGIYFLLPQFFTTFDIAPFLDHETLRQLFFVAPFFVTGLGLIILGNRYMKKLRNMGQEFSNTRSERQDDVLNLQCAFGAIEQMVFEKPFNGAVLFNAFGGITLDLRNTELPIGDTMIDIKCAFGGVILIIPNHWNINIAVQPIFGGVDDKRDHSLTNDSDRRLIIRGFVVFSGVEIRSSMVADPDQYRPNQPTDTENIKLDETVEIIDNISV